MGATLWYKVHSDRVADAYGICDLKGELSEFPFLF